MAKQRTLVFEFAEADVLALGKSRCSIVLAIRANPSSSLVWLAIAPSSLCTITWELECGVYAAMEPPRTDTPMKIAVSLHPVPSRSMFHFANGTLGNAVSDAKIPHGHYDIRNNSSDTATFGLIQRAVVNGTPIVAPVSAVAVPPGFTADFVAADRRLFVWLQRDAVSGARIERPDRASEISVGEHDAKRYGYDPATGSFVDL